MIGDAIAAACSVVLLLVGVVTTPIRTGCDRGYWLDEGVRRDGSFRCVHVPIGDDAIGPRGETDDSVVPPGEIDGRIWCTGGHVAIVIDSRTVGCQRGWMQ